MANLRMTSRRLRLGAFAGVDARHIDQRERKSSWWRLTTAVSPVALTILIASLALATPASSVQKENPYSIGSTILALKLTRLQMLTSKIGVGVAPITTYSGRLVRAYLVRTDDAGTRWHVTGIFPKAFYPWTTAFATPSVGYVIDGTSALFTHNAGRTWSTVKTTGAPLSISVKGHEVWIPVENCVTSAMQGPCSTHLDTFSIGGLSPSAVSPLISDQPMLDQVSPTSGYSFEVGSSSGAVLFTSTSGSKWSVITNPCQSHSISSGVASSLERIFVFCDIGSPQGSGPTVLFKTIDGGITWSKVSAVPDVGAGAEVGTSGRFLWVFTPTLWESSDEGRTWTSDSNVSYGPSGYIATSTPSRAWHPLPGRGIFRTLDGKKWTLIK